MSRRTLSCSTSAGSTTGTRSAYNAWNSRTLRFTAPPRHIAASGYSLRAATMAAKASKSVLVCVAMSSGVRMSRVYGSPGAEPARPRTSRPP